MKVTAIYKASNGDVFFEHDGHCEELTKGQQDALMQEAIEFAKTAVVVVTLQQLWFWRTLELPQLIIQ